MNLLSRNAYPLDSIKEGADEPVANDTCQIAYECNYTNKSKAHPPGWALAFNTKTLYYSFMCNYMCSKCIV